MATLKLIMMIVSWVFIFTVADVDLFSAHGLALFLAVSSLLIANRIDNGREKVA